jgi:hypothetical protein
MVLDDSPAMVLATWLQQVAIGVDPLIGGATGWPIFVDQEADLPNEALAVYNTAGVVDGRIHNTGETIVHEGIQFSARSASLLLARQKIDEIALKVDALIQTPVTVGSNRYNINAINKTSGVLYAGPDSKTRQKYTLNATATIQEL